MNNKCSLPQHCMSDLRHWPSAHKTWQGTKKQNRVLTASLKTTRFISGWICMIRFIPLNAEDEVNYWNKKLLIRWSKQTDKTIRIPSNWLVTMIAECCYLFIIYFQLLFMILFISPASICGKLIMAEKVYIQNHITFRTKSLLLTMKLLEIIIFKK